LVIVGHGTRSAEGVAQFAALVERVRTRAGGTVGDVEGGFIELSRPPLTDAVGALAAQGHRALVALPLVLTAAGHGKGDIPAALAREQQRHPGLSYAYGRPLGPHPMLHTALEERIDAALAGADRADTWVALIGRGSTDPDANAEVAKVIYRHLPGLGERFRAEDHIAATIDVSGPGIFVFKEVAEKAGVDIELFEVPLLNPKLSKFAADFYIMPDATAGTNGAVALFLHESLAEEVVKELSKIPHLSPRVVGRVVGRGEGRLHVPPEALSYISNRKLKEKLAAQAPILAGLGVAKPARARIYVEGDVQGVGYRPYLRSRARVLGLTGYARNLPDGRVEVVVEGDADAIRKFAEEACRGRERCRVAETQWERDLGEFKDFEIL